MFLLCGLLRSFAASSFLVEALPRSGSAPFAPFSRPFSPPRRCPMPRTSNHYHGFQDLHGFRDWGKGRIGRIMAGQNHILVGKKRGEREGPCPQITGPMHADGRRKGSPRIQGSGKGGNRQNHGRTESYIGWKKTRGKGRTLPADNRADARIPWASRRRGRPGRSCHPKLGKSMGDPFVPV